MPLGVYISIPFCRSKCSYCNFASGVFSGAMFGSYVDRVCDDISRAGEIALKMQGHLEREVETIYLGGGTPTVLAPADLERVFMVLRENFAVYRDAEITVECAPGTLSPAILETLLGCGVNRVSLGVQSFVDAEAAAVGRLHTRASVLDDIAHLRSAGISNINVDLIAGLPHQDRESWRVSLENAIVCNAPHVSVYMLEVDEDSRLGRELIAGGVRYHAHFVPDEDATADLYIEACEQLESAGLKQYEISNFASPGRESRHNLKYWRREPYLGLGVDAHSMLPSDAPSSAEEAVRFSTSDSLEGFLRAEPLARTPVSPQAALEETFFLGLRLNRGLQIQELRNEFGEEALAPFLEKTTELVAAGLLVSDRESLRLTARGRLLSNEVFAEFLEVKITPVG